MYFFRATKTQFYLVKCTDFILIYFLTGLIDFILHTINIYVFYILYILKDLFGLNIKFKYFIKFLVLAFNL